MKFLLPPFALLVATATAAPTSRNGKQGQEGQQGQQGQQILATFDDLPSLPGVSELNPVGNYRGLKWQGFDVLQAGVAGINAVLPQSGINVAANSIVSDTLQGGISLTPLTAKSFDFQSLYFGCVVNTVETAASAPEQCTVAFTAYKDGKSIAHTTINEPFTPTNPLISKMAKATFPSSFSGLDRLDIAVVQSITPGTLTALEIDNVSYQLNSK